MNAEQYAQMRETGTAPCGCQVVFDGDMQTVHHDCNTNRQKDSDKANKRAAKDHAERQERAMLLRQIPLDMLREMVHGKVVNARASARA